ncbi:hypothetical protein ROG8370_03312 [Roseovarius gaetbuli]|uniref:DUF2793 domain-containing protein n=1 Tax=Roseovarius gaetbuli TaxID=1356575 RepID=A0A1X7A3W4_9RHOB|nr:DUF2793 domain-containing protein [Roseovarius gaetbuli]SLN69920.1 hypothetical protein ROG8370_03312 [Roseovarius gaetbuli]
MTDTSLRLNLPYIQPAQAQKHVTHNEALMRLDALVQTVVQDHQLQTPPAAPAGGGCYVVAPGGTGAWAGQDNALTLFDGAGWVFLSPQAGWSAYCVASNEALRFDGQDWAPAADLTNLPQLGIAAQADDTNRLSLSSAASLFNHAGAGHQLKLNKAQPSDTASLLYQTGFSGRAEMGLAGDDAWSLKTSSDGTDWREVLRADPVGQTLTLAPAGQPRMTLSDTDATLNVPLGGSAVQADVLDTTAGTLMATGAFGLGVPLQLTGPAPLQDRDLKPGLYTYMANSLLGGPESDAHAHTLVVQQTTFDGRRSYISLRTTGTSAARAWFGSQSSPNSAIYWTRLIDENQISGTVTQNGGTPTGAIIEKGSNANGNYTRWADGTQICSVSDLSGSASMVAGQTVSGYWTYPAAFVTFPNVTISPRTLGTQTGAQLTAEQLRIGHGHGPNGAFWAVHCRNASISNVRIDATAIGRWY